MTVNVITGDCLDVLRSLPDQSVHTCVTSPPYWGLRDYGHAGQLGLEPTPDEYVAGMVRVFAEVRRVLRDDATLWLNLGDSYAGSGPSGASYQSKTTIARESLNEDGAFRISKTLGQRGLTYAEKKPIPPVGLKAKDLCGIPWRVAFALQADGWYLRSDIIWAKPNPMPESVTDRPTKAHEYIFLLSKSASYYYDQDAIRQEPSGRTDPITSFGKVEKRGERYELDAAKGANRRTVWTIATQPYSGAHFATFPPDLIEPCILAGCPVGGTVIDPFGGAGTTGLVADRLQRDAILIELNPEYAQLARERIQGDSPLFAEVA